MASPILTFFFSVECGNLPAAASGYTECAKTALETNMTLVCCRLDESRYVFSGTNVYTIRTLKCVDKPKVLQRYQPFTSFRCFIGAKFAPAHFKRICTWILARASLHGRKSRSLANRDHKSASNSEISTPIITVLASHPSIFTVLSSLLTKVCLILISVCSGSRLAGASNGPRTQASLCEATRMSEFAAQIRVFVVDDEGVIASSLAMILRFQGGFMLPHSPIRWLPCRPPASMPRLAHL